MDKPDISMSVIRRMPRYYRYVSDLCSKGKSRISSRELAELMGVTASQVRQDFNCFGGFGQQGYGYNLQTLEKRIGEILGLHRGYGAIILGIGNMGRALMFNFNFRARGFRLLAGFDVDERAVGNTLNGVPVYSMDALEGFCQREKPSIAVLTLPKSEASAAARKLKQAGIIGIWNFTGVDLNSRELGIRVENVIFSESLMTLCYLISADGQGV